MVICQKDLGVIPEDRPSYQSRPSAPRYNVDGSPGASRSCLVVPGLGGGGRKKKKGGQHRNRGGGSMLLTSSSGSTTDQSSTGDHIFSSSGGGGNDNNSDRRGLLESANRLTMNTNDWYTTNNNSKEKDDDENNNDGFFGTGVSSSDSQKFSSPMLLSSSASPERGGGVTSTAQYAPLSSPPPSVSAGSSSVSNNSIDSNSRSSSSRRNVTNAINQDSSVGLLSFPTPTDRSHGARRTGPRKHAYDGEMEPDGVRGQEAEVIPIVSPEQSSIPIRQFYANDPTINNKNANTSGSSSISSSSMMDNSNNILNESTTSSQDLRSMIRPDFVDNNNNNSNKQYSSSGLETTTFSSPGRQFLKSSPVMLSSTHTPKRDDRRISTTRNRVHTGGNDDESDSSETSSRVQIVQNNVAEIVQQQQQEREPSLKSPLPPTQLPQHTTPPRQQQQQQQLRQRPQQRQQQPVTPQQVASPGGVSTNTPRTPTASSNEIPGATNNNQPVMTFRGKSAPVNVDDTSFEAPEENVTGIHAMAMEHVMRGEYDMALQAFSQVLKVYLDIHGRAHPLTASAYHNLGTVHSKRAGLLLDHTLHQRHCREQALLCFQAAARSARDSPQLGPGHPNVAVSLVRIGFLLLQSRQYQNAVITFHEALRIRVEHYGPTHGLVANLYNNLGVCHMHLQEFPQGRKYLQQALDIQKQLLNEDDFSTTALLELADTLCNIGGLCLEWIRQQGPDARHALDAESAFLEAMEVRTKVLGENHALTNQVRSLHDMVRSIPLPKLSPRSKSSLNSGGGGSAGGGGSVTSSTASPARQHRLERSPGGSPSMMTSSPPQRPSPGRPYATSTSPPLPTDQHKHQTKAGASSAAYATKKATASSSSPNRRPQTPDELHMPTLVDKTERLAAIPQQQQRLVPPSPITTVSERALSETTNRSELSSVYSGVTNKSIQTIHMDRTVQSELGSSVFTSADDMECYDASEESCLLAMRDDQASTVVSYSQTTSKLLSGETNVKTSDDRLDCIQQAKSLLNAHKQYMDSPQTSTLIQEAEEARSAIHPRHHHTNDIAIEDGLAPLGGEWPSASTNERITQEILQDPAKHLHSIQKGASNNLKRGQYAKGLHLFEIVLECQRQKNGMLHEDVGSALHNVGIAHLRMDDHYSALQSFEESLRIRKGALGRNHPLVAVSLVKVGVSLLLLKRLEDAIWIFREALSVRKSCFGALHPSIARIYNNIGCVHVEFQELKEARRAFEAALDIQRNALVNDPQNGPIIFGAATTLQNLAILYQKRGLQDKAVVVLDEALLLLENVLGESHPNVLETLDRLSVASAAANLGSAALKHNSELLERLYGEADFDKVQESNILYRMSKVHKQNHDVESQIAKLHLALKVLDTAENTERKDALLQEIQRDLRMVRQDVEKEELDWVGASF